MNNQQQQQQQSSNSISMSLHQHQQQQAHHQQHHNIGGSHGLSVSGGPQLASLTTMSMAGGWMEEEGDMPH
uniref:Uncharacterized protein n=1 Tax=Ditylenchus dipsaci TaxID=166011 RepID=A0A915DM41_9BILA